MPKPKVYPKKQTKKTYFKKQPKKAVIPRNMVSLGKGFPKKLTMTHKYYENISAGFSSTTGAINSYLFSCNSLFDPNITGTGHQPMFFDQMSAIYDHYVVIGSKCKFIVTPETTTTNTSRCAAYIDDNGTVTTTSLDAIAEQTQGKGVKYFLAGNNNYQTLNLNWSAKKFYGKSVLANADLKGSASTSPNEQSYYVIAVQADDVATIGFNFTVEIEYIAVWMELKEFAQS